jgi:DNA polymerase
MTEAERQAALEAIATEVRACTRCRLHETRTKAVPGEGHPSTEVVFVGEGPGQNEDRSGRPFVGRAGDLLVKMLGTIGWRRDEVFITNVVKCRPPDNRDPEPDEVAACAPYLRRQLEILDPALVVTLGRHSLGRFMPGARISQVHGTTGPVDPATGARAAVAFALYHPAAALRSTEVERQSYEDVLRIPEALVASRARREAAPEPVPVGADAAEPVAVRAEPIPAEIELPRLSDAIGVADPVAMGLASDPRPDERAGSDLADVSGPVAERDLAGGDAIGGLDEARADSTTVVNGSDKHGIHVSAGHAADETPQPPTGAPAAPHTHLASITETPPDLDQLTAF